MGDDDLVLTTFKVPVQTHSRTQGCKWLTEMHHEKPAWFHPAPPPPAASATAIPSSRNPRSGS
jgi:hypothetical protein